MHLSRLEAFQSVGYDDYEQSPHNYSGPFNKIQVAFALAPPEFPFTLYTISLYNVNDTSPVSAVNVTKDVSVSNQHTLP